MASAFSHIAIPIALAMVAGRKRVSLRLALFGAIVSTAPDLDAVAFYFGIPYESQWGHRGFSHSIAFALLVAVLALLLARRLRASARATGAVTFLSMVSHGVLDALTDGGLGVAFLWPLTSERYFLPWRVIEVSPISIARFFTERGWSVLRSEAIYIWLPALSVGALFCLRRRHLKQA